MFQLAPMLPVFDVYIGRTLSHGHTTFSNFGKYAITNSTGGSGIAEGPRDVLVSRNSATTKYRYRVALFA